MNKFVLSVAMCLALTLAASADVIPVACDSADQQVSETSMSWVGSPDMRVGGGSTEGSVAVFVFELPALPAGEAVSNADLAFSIIGGNNWNALFEKGLDLYAVRMSSSSAVQQSDYYKGPYNQDASATAIEDYIIYESEQLNQAAPGEVGRQDTSAAGEAALAAWLQSMYDSVEYDSGASNYVFLRLSPREDFTSTYRYWSVATADYSSEADRPLLTITTIPEPATIGLLAIGAMALIRRRR